MPCCAMLCYAMLCKVALGACAALVAAAVALKYFSVKFKLRDATANVRAQNV